MKKETRERGQFTELDQKLFELQALFDLSKALNSSLNLKKVLDTILLTPMGRLLIGKGLVLINDNSNTFVIETIKGLRKQILGKKLQVTNFPDSSVCVKELDSSPEQAFFEKNEVALIIPVHHDAKKLGLIGFGKKILGGDYTDSDLEYLNSLSNIAATAIQNGIIYEELNSVNRQLDKKVQELNTLYEIGKELNSAGLDSDKVLNLLAYSLMGELMVNRCLVFLKEQDTMVLALNKGFQDEKSITVLKDQSFLESLRQIVKPVVVSEVEDLAARESLDSLGIVTVVPMQLQNESKGILALGEKITRQRFSESELEFLTTLCNQSMISIENARLFEQEREKQKLEQELSIAKEIQTRLLPASCPEVEGYDIAGINLSSLHVGGDYYDCVKINDEEYICCIADVSGKGVPAALLMANLQASLHALLNTGLSLSEITARINNLIHRNTTFDKFITFFLALLNVKERTLISVNAGHNPPYIFSKNGGQKTLTEGGLILGMMPNVAYQEETLKLEEGDCVLMFTDGVSEAMNLKEEEFEDERIVKCYQDNQARDAEGLIDSLIKAVRLFTTGAPQTDDITILTVKVL